MSSHTRVDICLVDINDHKGHGLIELFAWANFEASRGELTRRVTAY